MWCVMLLVLALGGAILLVRSGSKKVPSRSGSRSTQPRQAAKPTRRPSLFDAQDSAVPPANGEPDGTRRLEIDLAAIMGEHQQERARIEAEILREVQGAADEAWAEADEEPEPVSSPTTIRRSDYVPKELEERYLTRDEAGLPTLRFVDVGDRLAIWSPLDGGALINPKGPGLRRLGLFASSARGSAYYQDAYRRADLSKGQWVDLKREPDNPHDMHAVAMCAPDSRATFAYVQRGRSAPIARRLDAGENLAAVSMRGPGAGSGDGPALLLIGSRADLAAMLHAG